MSVEAGVALPCKRRRSDVAPPGTSDDDASMLALWQRACDRASEIRERLGPQQFAALTEGCVTPLSPALVAFALLLPKVELHAHLNGSLSPELVNALVAARVASGAELEGVTCVAATADALSRLTTAGERMRLCFGVFDTIYRLVTTAEWTALAVQDVLLHYAVESTLYLEVRTSLRPLDGGVDRRGYLDAVCRTAREVLAGRFLRLETGDTADAEAWLLRTYPRLFDSLHAQLSCSVARSDTVALLRALRDRLAHMVLRLLISINRGAPVEAAKETIDVVAGIAPDGRGQRTLHGIEVVGVDLGGNCYKGAFADLEPQLRRAREQLSLKITLHAGEKDDAAELREMIAFQPDRYGHVVFADDEATAAICAQRAPLEICLSSNLVTSPGAGADLAGHHLFQDWFCAEALLASSAHARRFLQPVTGGAHGAAASTGAPRHRGHPISINTDDRGVFYTSMTRELLLLASETQRRNWPDAGTTECAERLACLLWILSRRALDDAFCASTEKTTLRAAFDTFSQAVSTSAGD